MARTNHSVVVSPDGNNAIVDTILPKRKIVIIETSPSVMDYKCCSWLASEAEIAEAKKERPDLIFREPRPDEHIVVHNEDTVDALPDQGIPEIELTEAEKRMI